MSPCRPQLFLSLLLLTLACTAHAQNTLSAVTSNNTSSCSTQGGYCQGAFSGMSDATSGVFNAAPGNVSHADLHASEYSGATTALFAHFMPWFCMQPGSTATGPGTLCNSHIQVGYNSNDAATVQAQMSDMLSRGLSGPIVDWYGAGNLIADGTTQLVKADLEGRCGGGSCPLSFAIMEDQGAVSKTCPMDGGGTDQTNCILNVLDGDLDYINANYLSSPAYLRIDGTSHAPSSAGLPVVFFFFCESCFSNPAPNWSYVWNQLRSHVISYSNGSPVMWFVFRNAGGFSHTQSDGAFAWVNHYGSNDPYGLLYLDDFYNTSLKYPSLQPWGAAWKGFDNTQASWHPTVSITPQQCGATWLETLSEMTHNNDYGTANQLPALQLVTWNDYEEGTEIETGIDNCLSLNAGISSANLTWTPSFSAASGTENTVDHYTVFSTTDGQTVTQLASVPSGTHGIPLASMNLAATAQTIYVEAVGRGGILNKISNAVAYSPVMLTGVTPNSGNTAGGTSVTLSGTGFSSGGSVTFGGVSGTVTSISASSAVVSTPPHVAGAVDVSFTNPDGTTATLASGFTYLAPPSFTLSASPTSKTITRGSSASFSISLTPANGFTGAVTFSVAGLPGNTSATFSPTSLTTSGTTKLTISTKKSAAAGTYKLTVSGTSGTLSSATPITITLK